MNILEAIGNFNVKKVNNRREESTARRVNTLLSENSDFIVREAYNSARTNIIYSLGSEKGCKKILITSASPAEGKTTTALNLAITFAQTESRVLIIDADLRKPRIYRHLQIERENGLSDLLCGLISLDDSIKHCEKQNLDCITSGQIPPNPAELLSSNEMGVVLEQLSERYDYIFIDTPPITVVTEAAAMSKYVNGVILVARQNNTIHESIQRARTNLSLANAKILGYILNDVTNFSYGYGSYNKYSYRSSRKYGYGYGKGYGYGYGYNSYKYGYNYGGYGYGYGYKEHKREENEDNKKDKSQINNKNSKKTNLVSNILKKKDKK